ncbi:MAG: leucine-rich repeat protein [Bacillota bacterium]|nr:leucine-rich repeat protein [Bacillota bacterium]
MKRVKAMKEKRYLQLTASLLTLLLLIGTFIPGDIHAYETAGTCSLADSGLPPLAQAAPVGDYIFDRTIGMITDYIGHDRDLVIPSELDGVFVEKIGGSAFNNKQLISVIIPDTVTYIGEHAFSHNQLTRVVIPDSVTEIGSGAFQYNQLASVKISASVTEIRDWTFQHNKLTSVVIPNSVTSIGEWAFKNNQLESVEIPDSVTRIGDATFHDNQLKSVAIPDSVTYLGAGAFSRNQLFSLLIPYSITTISEDAFADNQIMSLVIPNTVTEIGANAFLRNQLLNVFIPNSVTKIGRAAFQQNQLTRVTIPNSVTLIDEQAFAFNQLTSVLIPDSVTQIAPSAFANNQLTNLAIPDSVVQIQNFAFANNRLRSVRLPQNLDMIGIAAFCNNELCMIDLPGSIRALYLDPFTNPIYHPSQTEVLQYCFDPEVITHGFQLPPTDSHPEVPAFSLPNLDFGTGGAASIKGPVINFFGKDFPLFEFPFAAELSVGKGEIEYDHAEKKFKVTYGYLRPPSQSGEQDNYWTDTYKELKQCMNFFGKTTDENFYNRFRSLRKEMNAVNHRLNFDFDQNILGYIEFTVKNGKPEFLEGGACILIESEFSLDFPVKPPVLFLRFGLEGSLQTGFEIVPIDGITDLAMLSKIEFKLAPRMGAVVKALVAEAEAGLKGEFAGTLETPKKSLSEALTLTTQLSVYLKVKALGFKFKMEQKFPEAQLYPQSRQTSDFRITADDFSLIPRLTDRRTLRGTPSTAFADNVNAYCDPQLVSFSDGRRLLLWIDDAPDRSDENRSILQYSVFDGENWSLPQAVEDDGTVDFEPRLVSDGTYAYLIWQNGIRVFDETVTLEEMAAAVDLRYARFDGSTFTDFATLTSSSTAYESRPRIAVNNAEVTVVWQENSAADIFSLEETQSLYRRTLLDGAWSDCELLFSGIASIGSLDTAYNDGVNVVAYTAKTGSDPEQMHDSDLFYIDGSTHYRLTDDSAADDSVFFLRQGDQAELYWCSDALIKRLAGGNVSEAREIISTYDITGSGIQVISNSRGDKAILWEQTKDFGSELYISYYDPLEDSWTAGVRLATELGKLRSWSSYLDDDANLHTAYGLATIVDDSGTSEPFGATSLYFSASSRQCDLRVDEEFWTVSPISPEAKIEIQGVVTNTGELPVSELTVNVYAGETLLDTHALAQRIEVAERAYISIPYTLPAAISKQTLRVEVLPAAGTDRDLTDNLGQFSYGYSDLEMDQITEVLTPAGRELHVTVRNSGYDPASPVTLKLRRNNQLGELLDTKTAVSLNGGETIDMVFEIASSDLIAADGELGCLFYLDVSTDSPEANYANNSEVVLLNGDELSLGDATGDGFINIFDIMAVRDHMLGLSILSGSQYRSADMTQDGVIDAQDLEAIMDHILGNSAEDPSSTALEPGPDPMMSDTNPMRSLSLGDSAGEEAAAVGSDKGILDTDTTQELVSEETVEDETTAESPDGTIPDSNTTYDAPEADSSEEQTTEEIPDEAGLDTDATLETPLKDSATDETTAEDIKDETIPESDVMQEIPEEDSAAEQSAEEVIDEIISELTEETTESAVPTAAAGE